MPNMRIGTTVAFCLSIMLNLTGNNELIELKSRTWWPEKKEVRATEKTVNAEEYLPCDQSDDDREAIVPPESVFFAIELA